jgi:hypothetical protein
MKGEGMKRPKRLTASGLQIVVSNKKIKYKIGTKWAKGDIHATWGDSFRFFCDTPFAIFVGEFTDLPGATVKPHGWADDSGANNPVFAAPVNPSNLVAGEHELTLAVDAAAPSGTHKYAVAVLDDDGMLITDDPQIIID